jgi:hypothetical protein
MIIRTNLKTNNAARSSFGIFLISPSTVDRQARIINTTVNSIALGIPVDQAAKPDASAPAAPRPTSPKICQVIYSRQKTLCPIFS